LAHVLFGEPVATSPGHALGFVVEKFNLFLLTMASASSPDAGRLQQCPTAGDAVGLKPVLLLELLRSLNRVFPEDPAVAPQSKPTNHKIRLVRSKRRPFPVTRADRYERNASA
jgi:hypothetical protein